VRDSAAAPTPRDYFVTDGFVSETTSVGVAAGGARLPPVATPLLS